MHFSTTVFTALALVLPVLAAPRSALQVEKYNGQTTGRYVIKLKPGIAKAAFLNATNTTATHEWDVINGFAGMFNILDISIVRCKGLTSTGYQARSMPISSMSFLPMAMSNQITEDGIMYALGVATEREITVSLGTVTVDNGMHDSASYTQTNAFWGLSRLSTINKLTNQDPNARNFTYIYDSTAGWGVDIYIIDTGKSPITHSCALFIFNFDQAFISYTAVSYRLCRINSVTVRDGGQHLARILRQMAKVMELTAPAGFQVGVAKWASIIAVKVLSDDARGSGSTADIISGIDWVFTAARDSGRPSIASLSLGRGAYAPLDSAIAKVAAGNDNIDAVNVSPARAPSAITVGASNIADARASFSNYGAIVDIFAPGENIVSAGISRPYATPHIAGLVATLISSQGNISPAAMATKVKGLDLKGKLTNIPGGTVNELAQNGLAPV
ncbi:hypothetical protein DXG01_009858 [Tephrocybe rancida]|nr:hypothetical protein DXG01_009858 [Tephrocybe rancida]